MKTGMNQAADRVSVNLETQRRLKMTPAQVADEIEALLGILLPGDPPRRDDGKARAYAEAWVNAGGIIAVHGVMIVEALRAMSRPSDESR